MTPPRSLIQLLVVLLLPQLALAQQSAPQAPVLVEEVRGVELIPAPKSEADRPGVQIGRSGRLKINLKLMAGWTRDEAGRELGFEQQGRIGYVIVELFGKLNSRFSYRVAINPVNETDPLPACGEDGYFYPNNPEFLGSQGPHVQCDPGGNRRVDMYKYIALDVLNQQGPIREAWLSFAIANGLDLKFGRLIMPIGFGWEEAGSFSSKDATRIQRIDAEGGFGAGLSWTMQQPGRKKPLFAVFAGAEMGDGNRNKDYDYFYFDRSDLDSNSALTGVASAAYAPSDRLEFRLAVKQGATGSRVERLPNYWASKRYDNARVLSGRYQPVPYFAVFGEAVRYTWGITETSGELLGLDVHPLQKDGFYAGAQAQAPEWKGLKFGGSFTYEALSRDDSLVEFFGFHPEHPAAQGVSLGKFDRARIARFSVEFKNVTLGAYYNRDSHPFAWLSGIAPLTGPGAYGGATNKLGFTVTAALRK